MEYRNLVTFLRVAELQNFTQAANALGYAQSTVTFHIQSLEDELGVKLFDRIGKKVSLTMAGEYLISYVNEMMHLETCIQELNKNMELLPGTLRIGIVESLLYTYAENMILTYNQKYPNISLEIHSNSSLELMEMLRGNNVDIILFMGKRIVDPNFVRDLIKPARVSFVTSYDNPLARKESVEFTEIAQQQLILPEKNSLYRKMAEELAAEFDCVLNPSVQINSTALIIELLQHKLGISFLPDYLTASAVEEKRLARLNLKDGFQQTYYVQILHHKNKWVTPQMKAFSTLAEEVLENLKE